MARARHHIYNDRLPPPATARAIEGRVHVNRNAVAGIFSFQDPIIMKDKLRPRGTLAAVAVAMLYVALVLGAPLIVRYGPPLEVSATSVHASVPK